jgi:hypothetical protein
MGMDFIEGDEEEDQMDMEILMEKVFHPDLSQCYQILSEYELQNKLIYKSKYYLRLSQKGIYESF